MFLLAAYLADRHTAIARTLLIVFGVCMLASGIYFGSIAGGGGRSLLAVIADVLPSILALAAAATIGPIDRRAYP